jgi:hypothetical protein
MPLLPDEAPKAPWQEVVAKKKATQAKLLAEFSGAASPDQGLNGKAIAQDDSLLDTAIAGELVDLVAKGETTCTAIANAYIKRLDFL